MNKLQPTQKTCITIAALMLAVFISTPATANAQSTSTQQVVNVQQVNAVMWPEIEAKSAYVYNPVGNQIIYEKNADAQWPTASLLKIMTAATADNLLSTAPGLLGKYLPMVNMKNEVAIDNSLPTNSKWLPETLIKVMLLGSSNKAAETLASQMIPRSSFISLMNFHAKRMGLTKTYFRNPSGLSIGTNTSTIATPEGQLSIAGGISTAREMAQMMWAVIAQNPGLLDVTKEDLLTLELPNATGSSKSQSTIVLANTNKILHDFPIIFGKTGFTLNAGGNLAVVMQKNETSEPYVIVVLGSTVEKRFDDVAKLASTTLQIINAQNALSVTSSMSVASSTR